MAKQPIQIAIFMEGGIVTAVLTDASQASIPLNVTIVDYDVEGSDDGDDERVRAIRQDDGSFEEAYVMEVDVETNPEFIARVVGR